MEVLSRGETTGEMAYHKVTGIFEYESREVYKLTHSRADEFFGPGNIVVTGNQPIWVVDKEWVKVEDLKLGDEFLTSDGTNSHLISLNKESYRVPAYNIEVEDLHTYFVGGLIGLWALGTKQRVRRIGRASIAEGVLRHSDLGSDSEKFADSVLHPRIHGVPFRRERIHTTKPSRLLKAT